MMSGMTMKTTSPSNLYHMPTCYIPMYSQDETNGLVSVSDIWYNFVKALPATLVSGWHGLAAERIKEWNGRIVNDVVVFNTEADKAWFILRWS